MKQQTKATISMAGLAASNAIHTIAQGADTYSALTLCALAIIFVFAKED